MNLVVLVAVLSCLNSGLYVTSRVLFVLSERGHAPRGLVQLSRRRVPVRSILIGSLFAYMALAASVLSPQLVFSFLVNASGAIMLIVYLLVCLAQIRSRRALGELAARQLPVRMWLFPLASYASATGIAVVMASMVFEPAMRAELVASLVLLAVVCVFAFLKDGRGLAAEVDALSLSERTIEKAR